MNMNNEKTTPKYLQVKARIQGYFQQQHYRKDHKIPSENELMEQFQVSRGTVRQALGELVNEGIIYRERGRGSFYAGAAAPSEQGSRLIGVMMPTISAYIYPHIIQGINDVVHARHYHIVLSSSYINPDTELTNLKRLLQQPVEGLLIEPSGGMEHFEESANFRFLKQLRIPVVFLDWAIHGSDDAAYVSINDEEGGFRATRHLIEAGHRRIGCVFATEHQSGVQRYAGYRKALRAHHIPCDERLAKSDGIVKWVDRDSPYHLTKHLLALGDERPTAIFFFNDYAALRGCQAIREAGLRIPDDISVIGFDDSPLAQQAEVPLTTLAHPKAQLGRWAAEILFGQLSSHSGPLPKQMLLNPDIIARDSVNILRNV